MIKTRLQKTLLIFLLDSLSFRSMLWIRKGMPGEFTLFLIFPLVNLPSSCKVEAHIESCSRLIALFISRCQYSIASQVIVGKIVSSLYGLRAASFSAERDIFNLNYRIVRQDMTHPSNNYYIVSSNRTSEWTNFFIRNNLRQILLCSV